MIFASELMQCVAVYKQKQLKFNLINRKNTQKHFKAFESILMLDELKRSVEFFDSLLALFCSIFSTKLKLIEFIKKRFAA